MSVVGALQRFIEVVREVIAAPQANLTAAMLLLASLALLMLIVVGVIALLVLPSPRRPRTRTASGMGRSALEGRAAPLLTPMRVVVIAVLLLGALAIAYAGTSTDGACGSCHADILASRTGSDEVTDTADAVASSQAHRGIRCVRCHEDSLPLGLLPNVGARVRMGLASLTGRTARGSSALVPSRRCLACHRRILDGVVESTATGVVMSHREPLGAGVSCLECHQNVGHQPGPQGVSMNTCVRCHDGERASATCSACHTKDTAYAARSRRTFAPVHLPPVNDCGGCHDQRVCDACHGLRMPHPQDFLDGEHARSAGFEKKELCWRCHEWTECGKCHMVKAPGRGAWGHGTGDWWRQEHGRITPKGSPAGCGCHGRSPYARSGNYCKACH